MHSVRRNLGLEEVDEKLVHHSCGAQITDSVLLPPPSEVNQYRGCFFRELQGPFEPFWFENESTYPENAQEHPRCEVYFRKWMWDLGFEEVDGKLVHHLRQVRKKRFVDLSSGQSGKVEGPQGI